MAKSNNSTVARRVEEVANLIMLGAEFSNIRKHAADRGWDVSDRQIRRYMTCANEQFAKATRLKRAQLLGRHLMQRRLLWTRALRANDHRAALQILRDEAQLQGLYPPAKIAATTPDGKPLTFEERRQHVAAIALELYGISITSELGNTDDPATAVQDSGEVNGRGAEAAQPALDTAGGSAANDPEDASRSSAGIPGAEV